MKVWCPHGRSYVTADLPRHRSDSAAHRRLRSLSAPTALRRDAQSPHPHQYRRLLYAALALQFLGSAADQGCTRPALFLCVYHPLSGIYQLAFPRTAVTQLHRPRHTSHLCAALEHRDARRHLRLYHLRRARLCLCADRQCVPEPRARPARLPHRPVLLSPAQEPRAQCPP